MHMPATHGTVYPFLTLNPEPGNTILMVTGPAGNVVAVSAALYRIDSVKLTYQRARQHCCTQHLLNMAHCLPQNLTVMPSHICVCWARPLVNDIQAVAMRCQWMESSAAS